MTGEIAQRVDTYLAGREPDTRPASFDYCFNYFQAFHERRETASLADPPQLQESCLQLGFYLASWGMLRGSTELLGRSVRYYAPVVHALADLPPEMWSLDVPGYDDETIPVLMESVSRIRSAFGHRATDTLVTKVSLGVLGSVPAFDTAFCHGFRGTFRQSSLRRIRDFYDENKRELFAARPWTLDFSTGKSTRRRYPVAKVIDMVFIQGRL